MHVAPAYHIQTIQRPKWVNFGIGHFLARGYRLGAMAPKLSNFLRNGPILAPPGVCKCKDIWFVA